MLIDQECNALKMVNTWKKNAKGNIDIVDDKINKYHSSLSYIIDLQCVKRLQLHSFLDALRAYVVSRLIMLILKF